MAMAIERIKVRWLRPQHFLADRTATQCGRLLASSCPSVRLSVTLCIVALRVCDSVYRAKSCTSVFLAGMFLFVRSDQTPLLLYILFCHKNAPKSESKFFCNRQSGVHWSCYVLLFTYFVNH